MTSDQDIYREWLRERLDERGRGSRKELAEFLGFTRPDPITRMLNTDPGKETREISAVELARMAEFFSSPPPVLPADGPGNAQRQLDELTAVFDRLPAAYRRQFLSRVLGLQEPAQSEQPPPTRPRSAEK